MTIWLMFGLKVTHWFCDQITGHCSGLGGYSPVQKTSLTTLIFLQKSLTLAPPISAVRAPIFKSRKLWTSPWSEFYHAYHFWGFMMLLEHANIKSITIENQICRYHSANYGRSSSSVGPIKNSRSVKYTHLEQLLKKLFFHPSTDGGDRAMYIL